jgi:HSP20 family protein
MRNLRLLDPMLPESFEHAMRRLFSPAGFDTEAPALWIRVDLTESDKEYVVKADIPGVKKEDISVRIDGNVVQIDAEMHGESESQGSGGKVLRSERYAGTASRTFSLAHDVDDAKADAHYADGVLTLKLPKKAEAAAHKLAIH